jgi:hypothetical protein
LDLIKILVFVVAFLLLLVIGRILSASAEVHAHELPYDGGGPALPVVPADRDHEDPASSEVLTGADIGLPFRLPPVKQGEKGRFNRPYYSNYYFSKTDLVRGPADPKSFCDDFFLVAQDPASAHTWQRKFIVATPTGLEKLMTEEQFASLYLEDDVVLVAEWDLTVILRTVLEEDLKRFGAIQEHEELPPIGSAGSDIKQIL